MDKEYTTCDWCDVPFTPEDSTQKCCSTECELLYQGVVKPDPRFCGWCGGELDEDNNGRFCTGSCDQAAWHYQEQYDAWDK